uniref:THAP domain-containing protein 1 n=1 Tax=Eptatretus burgeri TaxID=7764 RepID=A0A8C4Q4A3_EPTBU
MPSRCIIFGCSNMTKDGVSLHTFPKNPAFRCKWTAKVKLTRARWQGPSETSVICSAHFEEDNFESGLHSLFGIKRLRLLKRKATNVKLYHVIQEGDG